MQKVLPAVLLLLWLLAPRARGTEQMREHIIVGGQVFRMSDTPLEPFLDSMEERPDVEFGARSTDLWRGYVGTWLLEDGGLYLISLHRGAYATDADGHVTGSGMKELPLSIVFGERSAPIPASWWSGQLVLPMGRMLRQGYGRRGSLYERRLVLDVEKGRVTKTSVVDNRGAGRGLSTEDVQWVTRASAKPPDDGAWHDARSIRTDALQKLVPAGKSFRTRGALFGSRGRAAHLWIPPTPATSMDRLAIRSLPPGKLRRGYTHVELEAAWEREERETVLRVRSFRALEPGETIHHPGFAVPDLPSSDFPEAGTEPDVAWGTELKTPGQRRFAFGCKQVVRGPLVRDKAATILGVDVADDAALEGEPVVAAGLLQMWVVSRKLLESSAAARAMFGARGPGTYYRLVHPTTGALARPRRPD